MVSCFKKKRPRLAGQPPLYTPLAKDQKQFRLLDIHPGEAQDRIQCTLRVVTLKAWKWLFPKYETISYCWGDSTTQETITVNDVAIDVPLSSAVALRRVRFELKHRTVWIDAVCIDQRNVSERGHQVRIMRDIYANGHVNLIHLGVGNGRGAKNSVIAICSDPGAQSLLIASRKAPGVLTYTDTDSIGAEYNVKSLVTLFRSAWFKRLWVVQEAVLSKENQVYYGNATMNLLDITRAAACLVVNAAFVNKELVDQCRAVKDLNDMIDPDYGYWRVQRTQIDPSWMASILQDRKCADPVDKIYGLLGLITDTEITPDYKKTSTEVYQDAAKWMVRKERCLNILQDVRHDEESLSRFNDGRSLPSWVPDWNRPFNARVDPAFFSEKMYSEGPGEISDPGFYERMRKSRNRVLPARGIMMGPIRSVESFNDPWPGRVEEMVADIFMDAKGRKDSISRAEEILAMTLCAGMDMRRQRAGITETLKSFHAYHHYLRLGIQVPRPDELQESDDDQLKDASMYREAARRACKNRRFFATWEGFCGLGPSFTVTQDVAVILYGLNWPAILRPVGDKYRLLGLAYVHGIMDGEMVPWNDQMRRRQEELFQII